MSLPYCTENDKVKTQVRTLTNEIVDNRVYNCYAISMMRYGNSNSQLNINVTVMYLHLNANNG